MRRGLRGHGQSLISRRAYHALRICRQREARWLMLLFRISSWLATVRTISANAWMRCSRQRRVQIWNSSRWGLPRMIQALPSWMRSFARANTAAGFTWCAGRELAGRPVTWMDEFFARRWLCYEHSFPGNHIVIGGAAG